MMPRFSRQTTRTRSSRPAYLDARRKRREEAQAEDRAGRTVLRVAIALLDDDEAPLSITPICFNAAMLAR